MDSRQIGWYEVYLLLAPLLGERPTVLPGTPAWSLLPDDHPDKWQAILWASVWWCLDQDARQAAMAEASREISSAADWSAVAQQVRNGRGTAYIPRRRSA
jgi:DNA-binding transcriptional LysR family regulator